MEKIKSSSGESLIEELKCERELKYDVQEKDNCAVDNEASEESDEMGMLFLCLIITVFY